jgi:hypothetical protein
MAQQGSSYSNASSGGLTQSPGGYISEDIISYYYIQKSPSFSGSRYLRDPISFFEIGSYIPQKGYAGLWVDCTEWLRFGDDFGSMQYWVRQS